MGMSPIAPRTLRSWFFLLSSLHNKMITVNVLVDGFNLYHSLRKNPRYKWADLRKLSQFFIKKTETIKKIYYFSSTAHWDTDKVKRHNIYI